MGGMICTILAGVAGTIGFLMVLVMLMAGGANSTPQQIRRIKQLMLLTTVVGLGCVIGGAWLSVRGSPWWGSGVAMVPAVFVFVGMIWLTISQEMSRRPPRRG
jgi:ABC-type Mn2+/Zn2+ transport system permease subunit